MDPASVELAGLASDVTRRALLGFTDQDANTNVIVPVEDCAISLQDYVHVVLDFRDLIAMRPVILGSMD